MKRLATLPVGDLARVPLTCRELGLAQLPCDNEWMYVVEHPQDTLVPVITYINSPNGSVP